MRRKWKRIGVGAAIAAAAVTAAYLLLDMEDRELDDRARAEAPGQFVTLSEGKVHYELSGPSKGPAVVLVHGFSVPAYVWDPTFEALEAAGYRVLRYDLYGRGFSDRPDVDYDLDLFVNQLAELTDALKVETPFHLAGLSMGGPVTAAFASRFPQKVRSLALFDPFTKPLTLGELFPLNVPGVGELFTSIAVVPFMLPKRQLNDFYRPERFPGWIDKYKAQMRFKGFRRAILSTLRLFLHRVEPLPLYKRVNALDLPVLLIRGAADRMVTAEQATLLRAALPLAEYHEIPEAAHAPHLERPDVVNPLLLDFIAAHTP